MVKELLPIVLAGMIWGRRWVDSCVRSVCDNQAVVACLRSRTSRDSYSMHMLRTLAFVEARHTFSLRPEYRGGWFDDVIFLSLQWVDCGLDSKSQKNQKERERMKQKRVLLEKVTSKKTSVLLCIAGTELSGRVAKL